MVVDSSALIAVVLDEPEAEPFLMALRSAGLLRLSAVSLTEASMVLLGSYGPVRLAMLHDLMSMLRIQVEAVTERQARDAIAAFRKFGKGQHPARLNLGDLFSYALAMQHAEPLLFKGNDFSQTDVLIAAY